MPRQLTPYEKNFLTKHHFDLNLPELQTEIPVEYLVGKAEFRGLDFFVNNSTLIPRIETEKIVDLALENIMEKFSTRNKIIIADVCTGSGCIGVSLALELVKHNYDFHVYFSDISQEALKIAQKNFSYFLPDYKNFASFLYSNLFDKYPLDTNIDLVLSNPPYIPSNRIKTLDVSVKNYEPITALDGGQDGLLFINKIIDDLANIQNKVNAIIEIDEIHTLQDIKKSESYKLSLIKDTFGVNRFLSLFSF